MKSSHPDMCFSAFVRRALDAIRTEVPWIHDVLERALRPLTALIVVDGESALVTASAPGHVATSEQGVAADVVCTTSSRVILDLLRGRYSLLEALEADRVQLAGSLEALLAWHDAFELFLHGAVRARAFDGLLSDFRERFATY